MDTQAELDKRRRDIYAISIALIVFNLAGGDIQPAGTTLFGSVTITRTFVVFWAAWIAWIYFVWQFLLVARPLRSSVESDVVLETGRSKVFRRYTQKVIAHVAELAANTNVCNTTTSLGAEECTRLNNLRTSYDSLSKGSYVFSTYPKAYALNHQNLRTFANPQSGNTFDITSTTRDYLLKKFPWDGSVRARVIWPALFRAIVLRHEFANRCLPLIVAAFAPLIQIARLVRHAIGR